ncbi:MAG: sigma-54 dependent transcriptional regulator [Deltaproteobacteria bacterium]|nr:sigma-54 dependent transcriptional regulator [Deltaproteobacteria bacterium]
MSETLPVIESLVPEGLKRPPRILVVDDDESIRKLLRFHLRRAGCEVSAVATGEEALTALAEGEGVDLALLDLRLPGISGLETLKLFKDTGVVGATIIMTAHATMNDAVTALREGAYDFVNKSQNFDEVRLAIRNALTTLGLREEVQQLKSRLDEHEEALRNLIGESRAFKQVLKLVRKVAGSDITVLVHGESGSGKELIARAIHDLGAHRQRPYVAVNCAAIPENLLESELFGHEKGAFTGATARYVGKFMEAHEGTLFLDEIGELGLGLQAKLLRALQTREIQPVGGRLQRVNVRVVSATNLDLLRTVREGRFRADLYYRLAVFPIRVPPLRERPEDIPLLAQHFIRRFCDQEGKPERRISEGLMKALRTHDWPGNVRELENAIFRAVVLSEEEALTETEFPALTDLAEAGPGSPPAAPLAPAPPPGWSAPRVPSEDPFRGAASGTLEQAEAGAIRAALASNAGNVSRAALQLGIGRATVYRKAKKYGILHS